MYPTHRFSAILCIALALSLSVAAQGTDFFVDGATGNDGGAGTSQSTSWRTVARGIAAAAPGDTLWIKGGPLPYLEQILPQTSGLPQAPIRLIGYGPELPRFQSDGSFDTCIHFSPLLSIQYTVIRGIECDGDGPSPFQHYVGMWGASRNRLEGNTFRGQLLGDGIILGTSVAGVSSSYNELVGNVIDPTGPQLGTSLCCRSIMVHPLSQHNLIENNSVLDGGHDALALRSSYNVIRGNRFQNPDWRPVAIFPSVDPANFDLAEGNVFEGNVISGSGSINTLQLWSARNIIRYNVFHDNQGNGIKLTRPGANPDDVPDMRHNRIYHNVFYRNGLGSEGSLVGFELNVRGFGGKASRNVLLNNIFLENDASSAVQISITGAEVRGHEDTTIRNNVIRNVTAGEAVIFVETPPRCNDGSTLSNPASLSDYEACYPDWMAGNLDLDPGFRSPADGDFSLVASSPLRNQGGFLTRTAGWGAGTSLPVLDSRFFSDGNGIANGDPVVLEGGGAARVVSIDYGNDTIQLDTPLVWGADEGVHLGYLESAPEPGVYELADPAAATRGRHACGLGVELVGLVALRAFRRRRISTR